MTRKILAVLTGTAVTVSLLWVMQHLIATGQVALSEERVVRLVEFVRVERDETVTAATPRPMRPDQPDRPPPEQPPRDADEIPTGGVQVGMPEPQVAIATDWSRAGQIYDGDFMPIVQVAPEYPRRALESGVEGYVVLEFVVTAQGAVRDPVLVESSHSVFDRAAVNAVQRFRYRPRVIDGQPVEVPGVRFRISFELER